MPDQHATLAPTRRFADFAANLKHNLEHIRSERGRRKALDEMRRVLASYDAARTEQKRRRRAAKAETSHPAVPTRSSRQGNGPDAPPLTTGGFE